MRYGGFDRGFGSAIEEVIGGVIISVFINGISLTGLLPSGYMLMIELINAGALATLLFAFPKAGITYLVGWIFGIWIMIQSGLMGFWDIVLYLIFPIAILGIRAYFWLKNEV